MTPTGERMVYLVSSDTGAATYRVDLLAHGGAGQCSCRDWETRRSPAIRAGEPNGTPATMCKHVARVRAYVINEILISLAKLESK